MKPLERRNRILDLLRAMQKELRVEYLASEFGVSHLTIRRDLDALAEDYTVIRTHGGCLAVGRAALETEYHRKVARNFVLKKAVAQEAVKEICPGETILLNDGSTTFHVAMQINRIEGCTIYTNSLAMISEFSRFAGIKLFILGGEYAEEHYSLRGSLIEHVLETLHFDRVFLGADAVDEQGRCMIPTPEEARLTRIMMSSANKKILVADHTKIHAKAHMAYARLDEFDGWITSSGITESDLARYSAMTRVVVAPGAEVT
ncbi:MAG: DeoR/GlpR transcriptional regulator [Spirochaetaceae bacterium]|nr:MAG: DeoR/GlpR transcriptional regulator [Spirochaetaceae bacterium]